MSKQKKIEEYINTIVGATISTTSLATSAGCTLPTVLTFIKNNPHRFTKVSRGRYTIVAESISSAASNINTTPISVVDSSQFEW
jgi:hypothetical protein